MLITWTVLQSFPKKSNKNKARWVCACVCCGKQKSCSTLAPSDGHSEYWNDDSTPARQSNTARPKIKLWTHTPAQPTQVGTHMQLQQLALYRSLHGDGVERQSSLQLEGRHVTSATLQCFFFFSKNKIWKQSNSRCRLFFCSIFRTSTVIYTYRYISYSRNINSSQQKYTSIIQWKIICIRKKSTREPPHTDVLFFFSRKRQNEKN